MIFTSVPSLSENLTFNCFLLFVRILPTPSEKYWNPIVCKNVKYWLETYFQRFPNGIIDLLQFRVSCCHIVQSETLPFFHSSFRTIALEGICLLPCLNLYNYFCVLLSSCVPGILSPSASLWSQFSKLGVLKAIIVGLFLIYRKLCAKLLFWGLKYAKPRDFIRAFLIWHWSKLFSDSDLMYSRNL